MRTVSTVFCILESILTITLSFIYLIMLSLVANNALSNSDVPQLAVGFIVFFWVLWVVAIIIRIAIFLWREKCLDNGEKGGCGVVTLLFVSVLGGILTLCIPYSELNGHSYHSSPVKKTSYTTPKPVPPLERAQKISVYDEQLHKGIITRAEYDRKVAALDGKPAPAPKKPSEDEKIELIRKYKQLLDDGVITQEEFDKKKEDLLK